MFAIKDWSKSLGQPGASLRAAQVPPAPEALAEEPSGRTVQRSKSVRHWDFLFRPQKKHSSSDLSEALASCQSLPY